jgi:integrase
MAARPPTGIRVRHARKCPANDGATCSCERSYEAWVWSAREQKKLRAKFTSLAEAKTWRADAIGAVRVGKMRSPSRVTLLEAAEVWLEGVRDGSIRTVSGDVYKPSTIRACDQALQLRILPEFGTRRIGELSRNDLQDLADQMRSDGLNASTIRNTFLPVRAIYRRAVNRSEVAVNPLIGLELEAVRGRRDRIATPAEAEQLLGALPDEERGLWATAFYAGLRLGELRALRWQDVDLANGVIRVERSWDPVAGVIAPKSRAGVRTVPIPAVLREYLAAHALKTGRRFGLVFGRDAARPFDTGALWRNSRKAWTKAKPKPLSPIKLHEARHTFASLMIAAGVNAKVLSTYMGHSSITITLDRYGHLMPGNESESAGLLDAYLQRTGAQAGAQ